MIGLVESVTDISLMAATTEKQRDEVVSAKGYTGSCIGRSGGVFCGEDLYSSCAEERGAVKQVSERVLDKPSA
jgi:hypothetical protein